MVKAKKEIDGNGDNVVPIAKYLHKDGTESMIVQVFFKQGVTAPAVREVKPAGEVKAVPEKVNRKVRLIACKIKA